MFSLDWTAPYGEACVLPGRQVGRSVVGLGGSGVREPVPGGADAPPLWATSDQASTTQPTDLIPVVQQQQSINNSNNSSRSQQQHQEKQTEPLLLGTSNWVITTWLGNKVTTQSEAIVATASLDSTNSLKTSP